MPGAVRLAKEKLLSLPAPVFPQARVEFGANTSIQAIGSPAAVSDVETIAVIGKACRAGAGDKQIALPTQDNLRHAAEVGIRAVAIPIGPNTDLQWVITSCREAASEHRVGLVACLDAREWLDQDKDGEAILNKVSNRLKTWFDDDSYYRFDGRPTILITHAEAVHGFRVDNLGTIRTLGIYSQFADLPKDSPWAETIYDDNLCCGEVTKQYRLKDTHEATYFAAVIAAERRPLSPLPSVVSVPAMPTFATPYRSDNGQVHHANPDLFKRMLWRHIAAPQRRSPPLLILRHDCGENWLESDAKFGLGYLEALRTTLRSRQFKLEGTADEMTLKSESIRPRHPIAIVLHLFYPDLFPEFSSALEALDEPFDLYVAVPPWEAEFRDAILAKFPSATVYITSNRGRDVRPFLQWLHHAPTTAYQAVCKLHAKKSPHLPYGHQWRHRFIDELVGSTEQVKSILRTMEDEPTIGIAAPTEHLLTTAQYMGKNAKKTHHILNQIDVEVGSNFMFVSGTMFWFRPAAFAGIADLWERTPWEDETGQVDGTYAHAIERALGAICVANGFQIRGLEPAVNDRTPKLGTSKMKIALCTHQFFPDHYHGTEVYTYNLAKQLQELGCDVIVITRGFRRGVTPNGSLDCYYYEGIPVIATPPESAPVHVGARNSYNKVSLRPFYHDLLSQIAPDLLHVTHIMGHTTAILVAAQRLGIPTVFTATDFFTACPIVRLERNGDKPCSGPGVTAAKCINCISNVSNRRNQSDYKARRLGLRDLVLAIAGAIPGLRSRGRLSHIGGLGRRPRHMRQVIGRTDQVITATNFTATALKRNKIIRTAQLVRFGVDVNQCPEVKSNLNKLRLGFIGQIAPHKGLHVLLEALTDVDFEFELFVYGDPEQDPDYLQRICAIRVRDVHFMGTFHRNDIAEVLAPLDYLVVPSTWLENGPLSLLSALASKTPCIVSDVPGMAEFIQDGQNGFVFPMGDATALRRVLRQAADPHTKEATRRRTEYSQTAQAMTTATLSVYEEILGKRGIK